MQQTPPSLDPIPALFTTHFNMKIAGTKKKKKTLIQGFRAYILVEKTTISHMTVQTQEEKMASISHYYSLLLYRPRHGAYLQAGMTGG